MHDVATQIVEEFLGHGIAGAVAIVALYGFWRKDRELKEAYATIFEVQKEAHQTTITLMREMGDTIEAAARALERGPR